MLSIVIPVFNQHEMTAACIEAVRRHTSDYELVIVDNGSQPPIDGAAIRNDSNLGFPAAVNQGVRAASGDMIVLLNNDVIVTPGALNRLGAWADAGFDIVGPITNYAAGMQKVNLPTYENDEELNREAGLRSEENSGKAEEVNWVIGFCMAFRGSVFNEIGLFDESLWPCCGEEIDFCLRAREKGRRIGIAHDVYVHHFGSQTFAEMGLDYKELCDRNDKHLAERWGNDFWKRQAAISQTGGIRLNLGSGPFPLQGFINVDQFESVKPDLVCDVLALPYGPGTVNEIYAGHILEHFRFDDGMKALRYWNSILCHGGIISISTPDFDHLARKYLSDPSPERLMDFNDTYIYSGLQPSPHLYAYSAALLKKVMEDAGFVNLTVMPENHPYFPHIVDWQIGYTGFKP
jgi:predicted SAM-dependent methyltransferase